MIDPLTKPIMAENMMTIVAQAPQAPFDQEKADPDQLQVRTRTPTGTSHLTPMVKDSRHRHHHGPEIPLCAPPAAAYLEQTNNVIPVIKLHYLTPSSRRSTFQFMTAGALASIRDNDATTY